MNSRGLLGYVVGFWIVPIFLAAAGLQIGSTVDVAIGGTLLWFCAEFLG